MSPETRRPSRIVTSNKTLRKRYHSLGPEDLFIGRVRLKTSEEAMLLDLVARGVHFYPSATSQLASRSKVFQTILFGQYMVQGTSAIHDHHDLLEATSRFGELGVGKVVTKHDRRNGGMGIHLWNSVEEVYTQASFGMKMYPFVLQPFHKNCRDIRVVILGDYLEAYWRVNPHNFRNNLHCGGESIHCDLSEEQFDLCEKVMARGDFPYGHLDLMLTESGEAFLAEINLRGGIRGAKITPEEYRVRIDSIHRHKLLSLER